MKQRRPDHRKDPVGNSKVEKTRMTALMMNSAARPKEYALDSFETKMTTALILTLSSELSWNPLMMKRYWMSQKELGTLNVATNNCSKTLEKILRILGRPW
jgi:hypothetical protein